MPNPLFRIHAVRRMAERGIGIAEVETVLNLGETIASYPDDRPYPSRLLLGWFESRPLHVLVAEGEDDQMIVITCYEPDPALWTADFRRRR